MITINFEMSERETYILQQISDYEITNYRPIEHLYLFERILSEMKNVNQTKEEERKKHYHEQFAEILESLRIKQLITVYTNDYGSYYNTSSPVN